MPKRLRNGSVKRRFKRTKRGSVARRARQAGLSSRRKGRGSLTTHAYSRWASSSSILTCDSTELAQSLAFTLDSVKSYTEFTALYDRYRLDKVVVKLRMISNPDAAYPLNTSSSGFLTNPTNWYPQVWSINDYDGGAGDTVSSIRERQGVKCRTIQPNKPLTFTVRPAVAVNLYKTSLLSGYGNRWGQWVDAATPDVKHYGLNYVIDTLAQDPSDTYPFKFHQDIKYFFTMKDPQ